ncbi:hypothetical protein [Cytobacillus oceanisediminis]|uniref:hypothetical protein n=1 Tax=Cytobacillus oceanisediminis TaxID=665099 RepID=UPI001FB35827|nr:hypothetical protein [Cytobacillus oceanisediminis]UOE58117.1 hypothetical protein IRB79_26785 [Cytobacillus oceanisediminis]
MSFTPGPWKVGRLETTVVSEAKLQTTRHYGRYGADGGANDSQYYGGNLIGESILRIENATLISAAPDMYEVLQQLIHCGDEDELGCIIQDAKKAIEKAEGKDDAAERIKEIKDKAALTFKPAEPVWEPITPDHPREHFDSTRREHRIGTK